MSTNRQIAEAAEDILARVRDLDSPKDAISAILIAHSKISIDYAEEGFDVDELIERYAAAFKRLFEEG